MNTLSPRELTTVRVAGSTGARSAAACRSWAPRTMASTDEAAGSAVPEVVEP